MKSELKAAKSALSERHKAEAKSLDEVVRARVQEAIADLTPPTPVLRSPRAGGGKKSQDKSED